MRNDARRLWRDDQLRVHQSSRADLRRRRSRGPVRAIRPGSVEHHNEPEHRRGGEFLGGNGDVEWPAPSGGALVGISSTSSFVTVPSSITIAGGQTSGTFSATTTRFTAGSVSAQISAAKGATVSTTLTVTAAQ